VAVAGSSALSMSCSALPAVCCAHATQPESSKSVPSPSGRELTSVKSPNTVVPWLEGDSPTRSLTLLAPPKNLRYYRGIMPPLRVTHDVHLLRMGARQELVHERSQLAGGSRNVAGTLNGRVGGGSSVVEAVHAVAIVHQQRRQSLLVVVLVLGGPVHQHDGIGVIRRLHAGDVGTRWWGLGSRGARGKPRKEAVVDRKRRRCGRAALPQPTSAIKPTTANPPALRR
jgi:hypothetical protein